MSRREKLEEMLKQDPHDPFLHYALAREYLASDPQEGITRLKEVTQRFPEYVAAYFQLGQALAEQGEIDAARNAIEQGIPIARRIGDHHAEMEMEGFLETL